MKDLIKVANELQKVMDFEEGGPPVDGTEKELTKWVEEAVDEIDYEMDKFSDETVHILTDMDLWKGPALEKAEEEEEEGEVVEEAEVVDDNLVDQIKAAGQMKDLKIICKDLDEFKPIRGYLTKYKTVKELREVMLEMLEKEEKSEPKAKVVKKPVEKKEPIVKKEVKKNIVAKKIPKEKKKADTRIYAMAIVLKENPKLDIAEATVKSDALYVQLTGQVSNLREQRAQYIRVTRVMEAFDLL